jgi:hypothetical protein
MRRNKTAGEIIRNLETRIARLEREAILGFGWGSKKDAMYMHKELDAHFMPYGISFQEPKKTGSGVWEGAVIGFKGQVAKNLGGVVTYKLYFHKMEDGTKVVDFYLGKGISNYIVFNKPVSVSWWRQVLHHNDVIDLIEKFGASPQADRTRYYQKEWPIIPPEKKGWFN